MSAEMRAWCENFQRKLIDKGRRKGRTEGEAHALLTVLKGRGITVPADARKRILAEKDLVQLERWLERAGTSTTLLEVLGSPS